jgi:hypothetical protein
VIKNGYGSASWELDAGHAATTVTVSLLRRNRLFPEADALVADEERDRVFPALAIRRGGIGIPSQRDLPQVGLADVNRKLNIAPAPGGCDARAPAEPKSSSSWFSP